MALTFAAGGHSTLKRLEHAPNPQASLYRPTSSPWEAGPSLHIQMHSLGASRWNLPCSTRSSTSREVLLRNLSRAPAKLPVSALAAATRFFAETSTSLGEELGVEHEPGPLDQPLLEREPPPCEGNSEDGDRQPFGLRRPQGVGSAFHEMS